MRSGKMPLAPLGNENDTGEPLDRPKIPEKRPFTALSEPRLDGKRGGEYEHDLSRGDLSRPACSHVK
jgi:hypothetical protein